MLRVRFRGLAGAILAAGLLVIHPAPCLAWQEAAGTEVPPQDPATLQEGTADTAASADETATQNLIVEGPSARAREAISRLEVIQDSLTILITQLGEVSKTAEFDLLQLVGYGLVDEARDLLAEVTVLMNQIEESGGDTAPLRGPLGGLLEWFNTAYTAAHERNFEALGLANTTIVTFDNRKVFVPNRKIWGDVIGNRSVLGTRRVDVSIQVADSEDLDRVFTILHTLLDQHERVLAEPAPLVFMKGREDSWRVVEMRPWVRTEDWWAVKSTLPALVDARFRSEGIKAPAPRREIVHTGAESESEVGRL